VLLQVFEFGLLLLFLICIVNAILRRKLGELIGAAVAGLVLEVLAVWLLDFYHYSDAFMLQVFHVPICIGLGWGVAVYLSMRISDNLSLNSHLKPIADGVFGLSIDLAMDVVAIRIGLWSWDMGGFFGVPYVNYIVWFGFVYATSLTIRWFRFGGHHEFKNMRRLSWLVTVMAGAVENLITGTDKAISALLLLWKGILRPQNSKRLSRTDVFTSLLLTGIHVFFLAILIYFHWFGIIWLLLISICMLVLGLALHIGPLISALKRNAVCLPAIGMLLHLRSDRRK